MRSNLNPILRADAGNFGCFTGGLGCFVVFLWTLYYSFSIPPAMKVFNTSNGFLPSANEPSLAAATTIIRLLKTFN